MLARVSGYMNFLERLARIKLLLFLIFSIAVSQLAHGEETEQFLRKKIVVYGSGSPGPYSAGQRFIGGTIALDTLLPDSLSIAGWNDHEGTVTFNRPLGIGDSVFISFAVPPIWIRDTYTRLKSKENQGQGLRVSYQNYREKTPQHFPGLNFSGSKTFDVNVGSERQTALNQTLRLNISGKLTDDISLNAVVSDQNIPITPEGNTREITELDRVLIELKGPNFRVDMGDTDLKNESGRWLTYTRRLSGVRASITAGGVGFFGSGAISEGRYMSTSISPIEGNQGPYRLITENGRSDIAIIPGTERIWINGERLTRGFNYDYSIDYSTGEIIFAENRIIGSDMRIVCDYEYTSESFRKTFYSGGTDGAFLDNRLKFEIVAAREADDPDRPVLGKLDDIMRKALSQSGDLTASVTGVRPAVEDSTGTYDHIDDYFVYNPLK
ncbi:MAG: hypothetical protein HOC71_18850, partial [Candidatus Latescibacteria bacterium]|nr:hypothetical protein [Candidatus Latescibacterota bacterium]